MAPLDLDNYVEIARHCKYLPENDLKVSSSSSGKSSLTFDFSGRKVEVCSSNLANEVSAITQR